MKKRNLLIIIAVIIITLILSNLVGCISDNDKYCTITFEVYGGTEIAPQTIVKGEAITLPIPAIRDGFEFDGWFTDSNFNQNSKVTNDSTYSTDTVLFAKWDVIPVIEYCTISFEVNGGTEISPQTIAKGEAITLPIPAIRDGFEFDGWFTDSNFAPTSKVTNDTTYSVDTVLFAKWDVIPVIEYCTISFEVNGGTEISPQTIAKGEAITLPIPAIRDGFEFDGWFTDSNFAPTSKVTNDTTYSVDTVLFAKWDAIPVVEYCTITFAVNGGTEIAPQTIAKGEAISLPIPAIRDGFEFDGWFTDSNFNQNSKVTNDTTYSVDTVLFAKWDAIPVVEYCTITFAVNGGTEIAPQTVIKGEAITLPIPAIRDGFEFDGWFTDSNFNQNSKVTNDTTYSVDTVLYAKWKAIETDKVEVTGCVLEKYQDGWKVANFAPGATNVTIPDYYLGKKVINYAVPSSSGKDSIVNLTIEATFTSIDVNQFKDYKLQTVILPQGLLSIDDSAFEGCGSLVSVKMPNSLKNIGESAFEGCVRLANIEIPSNVTNIGEYAFYDCRKITSIEIPKSVKSIGVAAFYDCRSLVNITIPFVGNTYAGATDTHFGYIFGAFSSLDNYLSVPKSLKIVNILGGSAIDNNAFANCSGLSEINIIDEVITIGNSAFANCSALRKIKIPNSVIRIGTMAFTSCVSLSDVIIPSDVQIIESKAFLYCTELKSINIPASVTSIGESAFSSCKSLNAINFQNGISTIGDGAFSDCVAIKSIVIPNSVISIGKGAFSNCANLASISIPFVGNLMGATVNTHFGAIFGADNYIANAVFVPQSLKKVTILSGTSIEANTFYECNSLTEINLQANATSIGDFAFYGCENLKSIAIPKSISTIGEFAFERCKNLTNLEISTNITVIGKGALKDCENLITLSLPFVGNKSNNSENSHFSYIFGAETFSNTEDSIPTKLKTVNVLNANKLGDHAFDGAKNLTKILLNEGLTAIGNYAFNECINLSAITIPQSAKSIGEFAFSKCESLLKIEIPNSVANIGKAAFSDCINISEVAVSTNLTVIEDKTFYNCNKLTSIEFPKKVVAIGAQSFYGCSSLTIIEIPSNVINIGIGAFQNCTNLTDLSIPFVGNSLENTTYTHVGYIFGEQTQYDKNEIPEKLKGVTVTGGKSIGNYAFYGCTGFTYIDIQFGIESIGDFAFYNCNNLIDITIPSSVTSIGNSVFEDCGNLTDIVISDSVTSIGNSAFKNCRNLSKIEIPSSVTFIGDSAFEYCGNLSKIEIPSSVTSIGDSAFEYCGNLSKIEIPNSVTYIGNSAFEYCGNLTKIEIPSSVTQIKARTFLGCRRLIDIVIPDSVTEIEHDAFIYCLFTNIELPKSIKTIGSEAFASCKGLTTIELSANITNLGDSVFKECYALTIFVEAESKPSEWSNDWNSTNCPVIWNSKSNETANDGYKYIIADNGIRYAIQSNHAIVARQGVGLGGDIIIPSIIYYQDKSYEVSSIAGSAFKSCQITSVILPNTITAIPSSAFGWCRNLEKIEIPQSVTTIGISAFESCVKLTNIELPNDLYYLGNSAFRDCENLTHIKIPKEITSIGTYMFDGCKSLTKIEFLGDLTTIESHAFNDCSSLTDIKLPSSITTIGGYAFAGCSSLTDLSIPNSVNQIGEAAFLNCSNLLNINIPINLTSLWFDTFKGCSSLVSIVIPISVAVIEENVFENCSSLTIYAEAESKLERWDYRWNSSNCKVIWGYKNISA